MNRLLAGHRYVSLIVRFYLMPAIFLSLVHECTANGKAPDSLLHSMDQLQFDSQRVLIVRDLRLRRKRVTLTFERGRMIFLKPVDEIVTGLLFWGNGTLVAIPPNKTEKQQLSLFTGSPTLNEHFSAAYIRFTDDTYSELINQSRAAQDTGEAEYGSSSDRIHDLLQTSTFTNYRVLSDLMNGRKTPIFSAKIAGRKLGLIDFSYDQRKVEDIHLGQFQTVGDGAIYDTWCNFASEAETNEIIKETAHGNLIDARHYKVDMEIDKNDKVSGVTEVEFLCEVDGEWLLSFDLSRSLKVTQVLDDQDRPLTFFQNNDMSNDQEIKKLGHDVILVLQKKPLRRGEVRTLRFSYSGEVISRVGSGVFYVGSRGSWYPNLGATDRARYSLTFQYPKPFTIVATGDLIKEWEAGSQKHSIWESGVEIPFAGFNYGDYQRTTAMAREIPVEVFANRGIENVSMEVMNRMEYLRELQRQQHRMNPRIAGGDLSIETLNLVPNFTDFDTTLFAKTIAGQVASTILFFEPILGNFPYHKLAVSQIPGRFSQGWPSLLYVSSLSFLSPSQRSRLGIDKDQETHLMECLHAHEIAHQWWGNQIGWKTYHDLWMFEGFSNYLGYLSLKLRYTGGKQFQEVMHFSKERLLARNSAGQTLESAGPLWLGVRLASSKFPAGYATIIYEKGAWVLHMLRYLFSDPQTGSEEKFQSVMRDFSATYHGQLVSTEDFKKMAEKYMGMALDFEKNQKLDWFFDQWVYETGIPRYRLDYSTHPQKDGTYLLKGKIRQENVSEFFIMPVEVFGHFGPEKVRKLGRVVVSGNEANFKFSLKSKPQKVTLDENNEILCENKTL